MVSDKEDKREIVFKLKLLLKAIRAGRDIVDMELNEAQDTVIITFLNGGCREVDVTADSGWAIIKDVIDAI